MLYNWYIKYFSSIFTKMLVSTESQLFHEQNRTNAILKFEVPEGKGVINILIFIALASSSCRKSIPSQQRNRHQVPSSA